MADKILCQLVEAVKKISTPDQASSSSSSSAEDALKQLYPSTNKQFDPKSSYVPKKRRSSSANSACAPPKSKRPQPAAKPVLKDVILLPSPKIQSVPRGLFREYIYSEGFAESAIEFCDDMPEEEVKNVIDKAFKKKFESYAEDVKYTYARAIGSKVIDLSNGPYTGKLLKYVSKQGPIYLKSKVDLPGEHLQRWVANDDDEDDIKSSDDDDGDKDDESLLKSALAIEPDTNKEISLATPSTSTGANNPDTSESRNNKKYREDKAYASYIELIDSEDDDDNFEDNMKSAILASLEDAQSLSDSEKNNLEKKMKDLLQDHKSYCASLGGHQEEIIIRRSKLLKTAFIAIKERQFNCCSELLIRFSGEEGADAGGPRREFFRLAMQEIAECSGLLEGCEGHMVFTHNLKLLEDNKYYLAGRIVGMSLIHGGPGLCCLDPAMYRMMCDLPCCLTNYNINVLADSDIAETLRELESVKSPSDFRSFVEKKGDYIAMQGFPSIYIAKEEDAKTIKQALLKQFFNYRISSEIQQFKNGMNDVGGLWNLVAIHPDEFQPLFTYVSNKISRSLFKSLCEIEWSEQGSNKRQGEEATMYCWEVFLKDVEDGKVQEGQQLSLKDLLKFATGADAVPPLGFQYPLSIQFYDQENGSMRLPYASTCGLELRLPRGQEDPKAFSTLMYNAIFNSCGFGKA